MQLWCKFDTSVLDFGKAQNSSVLYSCLFACGLYLTTVRFVKRARNWALVTGDESAAIAVILPSYLPILYSAIWMNLFRAIVVVTYGAICNSAYIDMYPERSRLNPLNNVLYTVYMLSFEWFAHGFVLLFSERCVSYRALVSCVFKSLLLSVVTTALYVVGINYSLVGQHEIDHKNFYGSFQVVALGLPLLVVYMPLLVTRRYRSSVLVFILYSMFWRVAYISTIVYTWAKAPSSAGVVQLLVHNALPDWILVIMLFFRDILSPFFVYLVLLRDTHYWRGLPQRRALREYSSLNTRKRQVSQTMQADDEAGLNKPLLSNAMDPLVVKEDVSTWLAQPRYPPGDQASNRLQSLLDSVPVQVYIDFAFLRVDYSRLLGRGATASVFAGKLTLKNSTTRVIRSPSVSFSNSSPPSRESTMSADNITSDGENDDVDLEKIKESAALVSFVSGALATLVRVQSDEDIAASLEPRDHEQTDSPPQSFVFRGLRILETILARFVAHNDETHLEEEGRQQGLNERDESNRACEDQPCCAQDQRSLETMPPVSIGSGEFGARVVESVAQQHRRSMPVAVKMYTPPELDVATIEAYSKETEILTELSHPNIVPYYGLCVNPPHLCLVFALCPGGSLEDHIEQEEPWSGKRRMSVICDCVRALAYIHKMGFVHRDIKPGNFLLDEHFRCMLTDFGTCVRIPRDKEFVQTDSIAGSIDHMAPEVLSQTSRNMFYGYASDVFSLAILASSVINMESPYKGLGSFQIRNTVLSGHRPQIKPCPEVVRRAIVAAWQQQPLHRISAVQLLQALESLRFPNDETAFHSLM